MDLHAGHDILITIYMTGIHAYAYAHSFTHTFTHTYIYQYVGVAGGCRTGAFVLVINVNFMSGDRISGLRDVRGGVKLIFGFTQRA